MPTVIHRCMKCNVVRREAYRAERSKGSYGRTVLTYFRESDNARDVRSITCCGRPSNWNFLKATKDEAIKCDARCTNAVGFICNCSCGGEHHGRDRGLFTGLNLGAPAESLDLV